MKIVSIEGVKKEKVGNNGAKNSWKQLPLGKTDNVPVYSYKIFIIDPDGHSVFHSHPYEHMNYIIEGEGVLINETGERKSLKAGDFIFIEPGEKHQFENTGNKPFRMLCGLPKEFE
jgi:quercetin dioxygenase-like cupin family protein